ncbi:hypothetical protein [Peribacillus sp. SCS-155]|uniref:hypothetical protein n=1 Tax=Peribacillus sedimenti TaxID=3115297 RepID=UPI003906061E
MDLYSFITHHDPTLNLHIEKEFPGNRCVGGKYSPSSHSITLYQRDIEIQCDRMFHSLEHLEEYTWIVFAHELGHAMDSELELLSDVYDSTLNTEILYRIEENAWDIAEQLIPFIDKKIFDKVRRASLEPYRPILVV